MKHVPVDFIETPGRSVPAISVISVLVIVAGVILGLVAILWTAGDNLVRGNDVEFLVGLFD